MISFKQHLLFLIAVTTFTLGAVLAFRHFNPPADPRVVLDPTGTKAKDGSIQIGYFHGGRTIILYRTLVYDEFAKEGLHVDLMTKYLGEDTWFPMPDLTAKGYHRTKSLGKATGNELVDKVVNGEYVGATIGETAFVQAAKNGLPIVAVAELGHDVRGGAGHAMVLHKDINIKNAKSFKGLKLGARRSSGGDEVVLKEFISQMGLNPDVDVTIVANVNDEQFGPMIASRELDGGYGHALSVQKWIQKHQYPVKIHRALDWIDPEMSQSVLIFSKKFVKENPDKVRKMVRAYMRRIQHEFHIPEEERAASNVKGLQISLDFAGLNLPEHREVPKVNIDLLNNWQKLLIKHKFLKAKVDLTPYIDNSFVDEVAKERSIYRDPL